MLQKPGGGFLSCLQGWVTVCIDHTYKLEGLSRDNLSGSPFALVTYMTSFYKIRSGKQGKITGL